VHLDTVALLDTLVALEEGLLPFLLVGLDLDESLLDTQNGVLIHLLQLELLLDADDFHDTG
jgi:hypothetical protein